MTSSVNGSVTSAHEIWFRRPTLHTPPQYEKHTSRQTFHMTFHRAQKMMWFQNQNRQLVFLLTYSILSLFDQFCVTDEPTKSAPHVAPQLLNLCDIRTNTLKPQWFQKQSRVYSICVTDNGWINNGIGTMYDVINSINIIPSDDGRVITMCDCYEGVVWRASIKLFDTCASSHTVTARLIRITR